MQRRLPPPRRHIDLTRTRQSQTRSPDTHAILSVGHTWIRPLPRAQPCRRLLRPSPMYGLAEPVNARTSRLIQLSVVIVPENQPHITAPFIAQPGVEADGSLHVVTGSKDRSLRMFKICSMIKL